MSGGRPSGSQLTSPRRFSDGDSLESCLDRHFLLEACHKRTLIGAVKDA